MQPSTQHLSARILRAGPKAAPGLVRKRPCEPKQPLIPVLFGLYCLSEFCGGSEGLLAGEKRTDFTEEAAHDLGLTR